MARTACPFARINSMATGEHCGGRLILSLWIEHHGGVLLIDKTRGIALSASVRCIRVDSHCFRVSALIEESF